MGQDPTAGDSPAPHERTGRIGKYQIVRALGRGAMGVVYLAQDTDLERHVALKVMMPQIVHDPEMRGRFQREAKAVARLTHPNIVNVFDLGTHTGGSPYIAMELLKGQDLQKATRSGPPMTIEQRLAVIAQVLAGLAHAHEAGVVHRDIKPANVFLTQDGVVKIMDFGVARLGNATLTGTGNIVGTADYMSPEQVKGAKVDGRSDLFSVGCMLHELVAGAPPFHADNLMAIFYKITHEDPPYDRWPAGAGAAELRPILEKALAKPVEARYQTAYEFAAELRDYLKRHATSRDGQRALRGLLQIARPAAPAAASEPEPTVIDRKGPRFDAHAPTLDTPRTVPQGGGTRRGGTAVWWIGGSAATAAVLVAVVILYNKVQSKSDLPPATPTPVVRLPTEVQTPIASSSPTPETTATTAPTPGKGQRVGALLVRAANALSAKKYAEAKALYERVLEIAPDDPNARRGLQVAAERLAEASAPRTPAHARRSFVARALPPQPTSLPGRILFDASPASPKEGAPYRVEITFHNSGAAPVEIRSLVITTKINGGRASHPVPSLTTVVAPGQEAPLLRLDGNIWREDTLSWSMEAKVTTARGEIYGATLTWE